MTDCSGDSREQGEPLPETLLPLDPWLKQRFRRLRLSDSVELIVGLLPASVAAFVLIPFGLVAVLLQILVLLSRPAESIASAVLRQLVWYQLGWVIGGTAGLWALWTAFLYRPATVARHRVLRRWVLAGLVAGGLAAGSWLVLTWSAEPGRFRLGSLLFPALLVGPIAVALGYGLRLMSGRSRS